MRGSTRISARARVGPGLWEGVSIKGEQVSLEGEMRDRLPTSSSRGRGSGDRAALKGRVREDVVVGRGGFFRFFTGDGEGNDGSEYVALLRLTGNPSPPQHRSQGSQG